MQDLFLRETLLNERTLENNYYTLIAFDEGERNHKLAISLCVTHSFTFREQSRFLVVVLNGLDLMLTQRTRIYARLVSEFFLDFGK